jgi:[ribosomal protein S5]-alanine N-acetyltransferase
MRVLETKRLVLREFHQDDLKDLITWEGTSGVEYGEVQAQQFLNFCFRQYFTLGLGPWGMLLKKTGGIVGNCSFCHINFNNKSGEVNYFVAPQYRGNGLASEALGAILEFGFGDIGLDRIQARCAPGNTSSERVMQKAGMTFERMISSSGASKDGSSRDKLYAVIRSHFKLRPLE